MQIQIKHTPDSSFSFWFMLLRSWEVRRCYLLNLIDAVVFFQRFAEVSYPVIPEDQIYHILEPSFEYSNHEPKTNLLKMSIINPLCQVNMTRLGEYKLEMENPSPLPPSAVESGGLWAPSICRPLYQVVSL